MLPCLALNHGAGALLMRDLSALENPLPPVPRVALMPAVLLATAASVIASSRDLRRLLMTSRPSSSGCCRARIYNTSAQGTARSTMPMVNWIVMVAVLLATVGFGSSSALASACGIAVTVTMFITTLLTFFVVRYAWKYSLALALVATSLFWWSTPCLSSCSLKIWQGGWFASSWGRRSSHHGDVAARPRTG